MTGAFDTVMNLEAIYEYVRNCRAEVPKFPTVLPLIQSFEGWYQTLELVTDTDLGEAKRRKAAIDAVLGRKLPDNWIPADVPQTPPNAPPPPGDTPLATAVKVVAGLGALWLVVRLVEASERGTREARAAASSRKKDEAA